MSSPDSASFGDFERKLRSDQGFVHTSPQDKFHGNEDDQMSGMVHVLSQKIIENVWRKIWESIEASEAVPSLLQSETYLTEMIAPLPPEEACCHLAKATTQVIARKLSECIQGMEFQFDDVDAFSSYINYKSALALGGSSIGASNPLDHIMIGFKTGVVESWRMIMESCKAHEHQHHRRIDRSSLEEISRNSGALLSKLASTHMRIFANYSTNVNNGNAFALDMDSDPSLFQIEGSSPKRKLGISPKLMERMGGDYFGTGEKRYSGCPALYARGIHQPNVIEDLYQEMVIPLALHYLQPALAKE